MSVKILRSDAYISEDGDYRYLLTRAWRPDTFHQRHVLWVMLNPSRADAVQTDPTLTRCVNFSNFWGYHGLAIVNLFAYRATDPRELAKAVDPVGPLNDEYIRRWLHNSDRVVCAWGAHPMAAARAPAVLAMIREAGHVPHRLTLTKDGQPGHPLRLRADLTPIPVEAA